MSARPIIVLVVLAIACGPAQVPLQFDAELARNTLTACLDAWQQGNTSGLASRQPPMLFADDDLSAGIRLLGYRLPPADGPIKPFANVAVDLQLRDQQGRVVQRRAEYQVATFPRLTVMRSDP